MHYERLCPLPVFRRRSRRMAASSCLRFERDARSLNRRRFGRNPVHAEGQRRKGLRNIVLMGTGEPLDNWLVNAQILHLVSCPEGINIGQRHIPSNQRIVENRDVSTGKSCRSRCPYRWYRAG